MDHSMTNSLFQISNFCLFMSLRPQYDESYINKKMNFQKFKSLIIFKISNENFVRYKKSYNSIIGLNMRLA